MNQRPLRSCLEEVLSADDLTLPLHLPLARHGLQSLAGNPAPETVHDLVCRDPVLVATLFGLANAAIYRGLQPVDGIEEAFTRLGLLTVAGRVGERCAEALATQPGKLLPAFLPKLWQHSLGCALGARWLAERCGYRQLAERAHLAGLLHDIGKFALLAGLERLAADEPFQGLLVPQLVESILANQHVETGMHLHAAWGFPEDFAPAITCHHGKGLEGAGVLGVLVRLANRGCHKLGLGGPADSDLVLPTSAEAQFLGLDEIALAEYEIMLEDHPLLQGEESRPQVKNYLHSASLALDNQPQGSYQLDVVQS